MPPSTTWARHGWRRGGSRGRRPAEPQRPCPPRGRVGDRSTETTVGRRAMLVRPRVHAAGPTEAVADPFRPEVLPMSQVRPVTHVSGSYRQELAETEGFEPRARRGIPSLAWALCPHLCPRRARCMSPSAPGRGGQVAMGSRVVSATRLIISARRWQRLQYSWCSSRCRYRAPHARQQVVGSRWNRHARDSVIAVARPPASSLPPGLLPASLVE